MTHLNDLSKVYLENIAESAVPGKPAERLGAVTAIPKSEQDAARERTLAKAKAMREKNKIKEALDPVGQEDADIDNDGDTDKSDKYLHKRRKAIGKAISQKKGMKEGFSNWRQDLSEVMDDVEANKKIKEKKVENKITINPKLTETVDEIGGTLLEVVEVDEIDFIVESVYDELLEEGYEEDDIEDALEYALIEAKVTFGHDTASTEKKKKGLLDTAREKLSGAKTAAKAAVARGARKVAKGALGVARKMEGGDKAPKRTERKPATYRGAGAGTKEKVSSGSYTPPTKKKAEKPADPWEGSATTPPKAKAATKKAAAPKATAKPKAKAPATTTKRKRKSKLDDLLASVRNEETQVFEGQLKPGESYMDYAKRKQAEKKDTRMTVSAADKAGNTPAYKAYKSGDKRYKAAPGLDENTQIDEKTLTKMEMKKREEIVKSMKNKKADFEKRYPGRGKEVMYATATKMAKKVAEQAMELQPKTQTQTKEKPLDTALERQKYSNLKMMQQKQQQLQKQKLNLQKQGKLPLETD